MLVAFGRFGGGWRRLPGPDNHTLSNRFVKTVMSNTVVEHFTIHGSFSAPKLGERPREPSSAAVWDRYQLRIDSLDAAITAESHHCAVYREKITTEGLWMEWPWTND